MSLLIFSVLIAVIWGVYPFAIRIISESLPLSIIPTLLAFVWFISSLTYNLYEYKFSIFKQHLVDLSVAKILFIIVCGILFPFLSNLLYVTVVSKANLNMINIFIAIMSLNSLVSLAYTFYVKGHKLSLLKVLGICLISFGIFALLIEKN